MKHLKNFKQINEEKEQIIEFELIGNSIDNILDAIDIIKNKYTIQIIDESGHESGNLFGIYINIISYPYLSPTLNPVRDINDLLESNNSKVKIYRTK